MLPSWWGRSPVSFEEIGQPSFFSRWLLTWFGTFTHTCTASSSDGGRDLPSSGEAVLYHGAGPLWVFRSDRPTFIFQTVQLLMWFGTFTHTCTAPRGMVVGTCHLQGEAAPTMGKVPCEFWADKPGCSFSGEELRQGFFQPCPAQDGASSMAGGSRCDLAHLLTPVLLIEGWWQGLAIFREAAPTMGQVPCEFRADQPNFIFQLVAPDVIWHIYLHLYCSSRDGGRDLLSSGGGSPYHGEGPLWVWTDQPGCSFSGEELRQGSFQPCPAQDGASSMASGSRRDLAHLLTPVLLLEGWWQGLAIFRGGSPYHGAGPLWVLSRSANLHFSAGGSWCDLAHLLWPALLEGGFRYGPALFRGCCPHHGAGPLWVSSRLANLHFSASSSWYDLAHLLWAVLLNGGWCHPLAIFREVLLGLGKVPCKSPGECNIPWRWQVIYLQPCPQ